MDRRRRLRAPTALIGDRFAAFAPVPIITALSRCGTPRAAVRRAQLYAQSEALFATHECFILPVTQVVPFDLGTEYPMTVAGTPMGTYIDWMRSCWYVTLMANPAISVPAGFTNKGLPVGVQIVGRHRGDWSVLLLAHAFEGATKHATRRPPVV